MLYVHSKNKLSPIQEQDNKEEREESTGASSSKGQSAGGDQSTDDTQPMDAEAGGDSSPPFSGPGHQVGTKSITAQFLMDKRIGAPNM
eukprot:5246339-Karenia_brevis.AAC.1